MTRSIKEKKRLATLKSVDNITIENIDLLKVKFSFKQTIYIEDAKDNDKDFRRRFRNLSLTKECRENLKRCILPIANKLGLRELRLCIRTQRHVYRNDKNNLINYFYIRLRTISNKPIADLTIKSSNYKNIYEAHVENNGDIERKINTILESVNPSSFSIQFSAHPLRPYEFDSDHREISELLKLTKMEKHYNFVKEHLLAINLENIKHYKVKKFLEIVYNIGEENLYGYRFRSTRTKDGNRKPVSINKRVASLDKYQIIEDLILTNLIDDIPNYRDCSFDDINQHIIMMNY